MVHMLQEQIYFLGIKSEEKTRQGDGSKYTAYTLMLMTPNGADNLAMDANCGERAQIESYTPMSPMIATIAVDPTKTYASGIMKVVNLSPAQGLDYSGKPAQAKPATKAPEK